MGKQRTQERIRAEQEAGTYQPPGTQPDKVVEIFREHYELAKRRMLPEAAISTAAAAAQNFVASTRERVRQGQEDARRTLEKQGSGRVMRGSSEGQLINGEGGGDNVR